MSAEIVWLPPGKNCGLCGHASCFSFLQAVTLKNSQLADCPYYQPQQAAATAEYTDQAPGLSPSCCCQGAAQTIVNNSDRQAPAKSKIISAIPLTAAKTAEHIKAFGIEQQACYPEQDILGNYWDFVLTPLPGELSARKIILPFRADLPEKLQLKKGDIVVGRPTGAGCPVQHVLQIVNVEYHTGLLTTWAVGPRYSRNRVWNRDIFDLGSYHMIGFEGIASHIRKPPQIGLRQTFLPGFCMMTLNHTGIVNMILNKKCGYQVRIENIIILADCQQERDN